GQKAEINMYSQATEALYSEFAARDSDAVRILDRPTNDVLRSQYATDVDRILNCKFYNRGSDKTQVFSFYKSDDITRRSSHVQLVSRIARKIGKALRLNLDLIEAIAIGHDIGHTPFGHAGEYILSDLYYKYAQKYFNHNVHSVRLLNLIMHNNLTIQTLDGIICHCGEKVHQNYKPNPLPDKTQFYKMFDDCYTDKNAVKRLRPATLEGCVVRLSDMIAYIGKDRYDAQRLGMKVRFTDTVIGAENRDIINNVTEDVIANSMNSPFLSLSDDVYEALETCKRENNAFIYQIPEIRAPYDEVIRPMAEKLFERFLSDLINKKTNSLIYTQYLRDEYIAKNYSDRRKELGYTMSATDVDKVTDFIASMTDDYFLDVFARVFPDDELNEKVKYIGYFD
ncbi:MAG: HD domain-containing protein, partial [Clostridiales bacterium]|nr:HD domain-containing protein [Clostridiales bacterium]